MNAVELPPLTTIVKCNTSEQLYVELTGSKNGGKNIPDTSDK